MSEWMPCPAKRTLYEWRCALSPAPDAPAAPRHDLPALIGEADLPDRVDLVWHGVNDRANLRHFLASPVRWGECDVRRDPEGRLALRHDAFEGTADLAPGDGPARPLTVDEFLRVALAEGKGIKLDIKQRDIADELLALVGRSGVPGHDLWFNGRIDVLREDGFRRLRRAWPAATVQCPIDVLAPAIVAVPDRARAALDEMAAWGVDRFSLAWDTSPMALLLDHLDRWGHDVNLYAVENLDEFLRAVMLMPRSVTADFNFPEWHYFGRGAGRDGRYHRYHLEPAPAAADVA
ncbi:MAG TPA: hypothetical protein VFH30_19435 [Acidimicrobiales bacterium]|nr:hypothetical protein [Acidimicrobiales bacterium]